MSDRCINLSFRKAGRVISHIYDQALADSGLKCTQFSILRAVHEMNQTTNSELQSLLVLDQTTLTRGLKPLIRDGYIQAIPGVDRRQKLLSLTETGRELYQEASRAWRKAQRQTRSRLGSEVADQMLKLNDALIALQR